MWKQMWHWWSRTTEAERRPASPIVVVEPDRMAVTEPVAETSEPLVSLPFIAAVAGVAEVLDQPLSTSESSQIRRYCDSAEPDRFDVNKLPRLPAVLPELLQAIKGGLVSGGQLAELIHRDPVLVGEVIRLANSAHYRTMRPIESLPQAIVMLGEAGLRRVIATALLKPIHRVNANGWLAGASELVLRHAEACAQTCAQLGGRGVDAFHAYLAGMVCSAGLMPLLRQMDADVAALRARRPLLEFVTQAYPRLSLIAATHWQFPEPVLIALSEWRNRDVAPPRSALGRALAEADRHEKLTILAPPDGARDAGVQPSTQGAVSPRLSAKAPSQLASSESRPVI